MSERPRFLLPEYMILESTVASSTPAPGAEVPPKGACAASMHKTDDLLLMRDNSNDNDNNNTKPRENKKKVLQRN